MRDWTLDLMTRDELDEWREGWAFSSRAERLDDIRASRAPLFVLAYVWLVGGRDLTDDELAMVAEPGFAERLCRACARNRLRGQLEELHVALDQQIAHLEGALAMRRKADRYGDAVEHLLGELEYALGVG